MSQAGDGHMHHPEDFDPSAPREKGQDGMILYPGLRSDCPICTERAAQKEPKAKAKAS